MSTAERVSALSVLVNTALAGAKLALGFVSGSMALTADGLHSLSDVASSATVLLGLRIAGRTSADFPYGLYKAENLASLASAAAIFAVCYELARRAILGSSEARLAHLPAAIAVVAGVMVVTLAFSRYERSVAHRTRSPALAADSQHILTDTLSAGAVLVGLLASAAGLNVDRWITLFVLLFIARTGWHITVSAVRVLLDASVEREVLNAVESSLLGDPHVVKVRDLRGRNSGAFRFLEATVVVDTHDLDEAHETSKRLEENVRQAAANVDRVVIHYEPPTKEHLTYAAPVGEDGLLARHFGEAPEVVLVKVRTADRRAVERRTVRNPFAGAEHGRGIKIAEMLVREGVDVVLVPEGLEGKAPGYVFGKARTRVAVARSKVLAEALAAEGVQGAEEAREA